MGMNLDGMKDKAGQAYDDNKEKADAGLDKAADMADQKTGGKHGDKIDQGADKVGETLDGFSGDQNA
ncbi:MT0933-like antitoxin protein [Kytococcus aerolatus]|uniref:MT0933-like antitoxin protein n=1 Tax=Kytococcus aerolatus TaxID=592308 RepID=A0A212U064_9MICO|nr:antitoxin [Kytococcus aerolatus]SNC71643.1 MT0933-like antitoxin protein [Kytococcus aerolatus]